MVAQLIMDESTYVDSLLCSAYEVDIYTSIREVCLGTYILYKTIQPVRKYDNKYNTYLNAYGAIMGAHLKEQSPRIIVYEPQRANGKAPRKYGHAFKWKILIE